MNFFDFQENLKREAKPPPQPPSGIIPLSVSQLTGQIDRVLKAHLPAAFLVRGEVSNFKHHSGSGHNYFTLKDAQACINCVMWKSDATKVKFTVADGMELLATGRVAVYAQQGKYQFYVTRLQPLGQGALELAFQQVRAKLEAEGLFKVERKKPLPPYPARIALVTSRQTAALQDMFKVLRRYPWLRLFVYHVPVQGDGAAEKIAAALAHLNASHQQLGGIDLILLARGGGSLEDLWQFNEERVARAIVASVIPVVTGIGHEVDVSIADLVADHHAHTPTEAAQVAVQRWRNARDDLTSAGIRLRRALRTRMQETRARLRAVEQHEYFRRPLDRVNALRQLLDDRQRALSLAVGRRLRLAHQRLFGLASALRERHPRHAIQLEAQRLRSIQSRLGRLMLDDHRRRTARLDALGARLNALDPQKVLARGYSITTLKRTGALARRAAELTPGDRLVTRLADGSVESTVEDAAQGTLFTK